MSEIKTEKKIAHQLFYGGMMLTSKPASMHANSTHTYAVGCFNVFKHTRCLKMITSKLNRIRFCCRKDQTIFSPPSHEKYISYVSVHGLQAEIDCSVFRYCRLKISTLFDLSNVERRIFHSLNGRKRQPPNT